MHPKLIKEFGSGPTSILYTIYNIEVVYGSATVSVQDLADLSGQPYGTVRNALEKLHHVVKKIGIGYKCTYCIDKAITL